MEKKIHFVTWTDVVPTEVHIGLYKIIPKITGTATEIIHVDIDT